MTDQAQLEQLPAAAGMLPACVPTGARGGVLVVLIAGARSGRRRPGLADLANLIANALQVLRIAVGAPIAAGVWLWLAWANDRGHGWARSLLAACSASRQ